MRLDKFLSNLKYGSRKSVKELIKSGFVTLNGKVVKTSDLEIRENYDKIAVKGKPVFYKDVIILAVHKPVDYISSHNEGDKQTVFDLIGEPYNRFDLKIAGRLDLDSHGLMILTNDGALINKITKPQSHLDKTYEVILDKVFNESDGLLLKEGVLLQDEDGSVFTGLAKQIEFDGTWAKIVIDQGRFHQVKKMFRKVGYQVLSLKRTKIGLLDLKLESGKYQEISIEDIFGASYAN